MPHTYNIRKDERPDQYARRLERDKRNHWYYTERKKEYMREYMKRRRESARDVLTDNAAS